MSHEIARRVAGSSEGCSRWAAPARENAYAKSVKERMILMSDRKVKLTAKFEEIFGYAPGDDYVPRITNALKNICQGWYRESDLVEIIDTSIFSNGTSGMAITIESICVNDFGNSTTKFIAKYADIDSTYIREDSFWGTDITALELNMKDGTVNKISLDKLNRNNLMEFIDYAAAWQRKNESKDEEIET